MERSRRIRSAVILEAALLFLMGVILWENGKLPQKSAVETTADGYIKWVDFNVSYEALSRAYEYDIGSMEKNSILTGLIFWRTCRARTAEIWSRSNGGHAYRC